MNIDFFNLQIVIIDRAVDHWNDPIVKHMFPKMIDIKLKGFHSKMAQNYLPVDTNDFIASHILACQKNPLTGELEPVMTFKCVRESSSKYFGQKFPGRYCVSTTNSPEHQEAVEQTLASWEDQKKEAMYIGAFAIHPEVSPKGKYGLIQLGIQILYQFNQNWGIGHTIIVASVKTKANTIFRKVGFEPLQGKNGKLGNIFIPELQNEEFEVMTLDHFSEEFVASAQNCMPYWLKRIEVSSKERSLFEEKQNKQFIEVKEDSRLAS